MFQNSPISRAWIAAVFRPFCASWIVLMTVSSLVLTVQLILRAPFVPSLGGVTRIWFALLPETLAMLAPAAFLLAVVLTSRDWVESGDMVALSVSGCSRRVLVPPTIGVGVVVGLTVAICTQILAPVGRGMARDTLVEAAHTARIRPGPMIRVGDAWLRVGERSGLALQDVTLIGDGWIAWAPTARRTEAGSIQLVNGRARGLQDEWTMEFASASIAVDQVPLGIHNFERGYRDLQDHISRKESNGRDASKDRLTLYKRTTLPLVVPLLGLLGLPLGATAHRPYLSTILIILLVWAVQRLGDHGAVAMGPEMMAVAPFVLVLMAVGWAHRGWSRQ